MDRYDVRLSIGTLITSLFTFCCLSNSGVNWNGLGGVGTPAAGGDDDGTSSTCLLALKDTPRWTRVVNVGIEPVARRNANNDMIAVASKFEFNAIQCPASIAFRSPNGIGIQMPFLETLASSLGK